MLLRNLNLLMRLDNTIWPINTELYICMLCSQVIWHTWYETQIGGETRQYGYQHPVVRCGRKQQLASDSKYCAQ